MAYMLRHLQGRIIADISPSFIALPVVSYLPAIIRITASEVIASRTLHPAVMNRNWLTRQWRHVVVALIPTVVV